MRPATSLLLLAAASAAAPAFAGDRAGLFAGVGAAYSSTRGVARGSTTGTAAPFVAPLAGLPIEDDDVAWRGFVGWSPSERWSIEAGYVHLGTFSSGPVFFGILGTGVIGEASTRVEVRTRAWTAGASFRNAFGNGPWYGAFGVGLARASFDVSTRLPTATASPTLNVPTLPPPTFLNPGPVAAAPIPGFSSPKDETGWYWGVAVGWRFADRWSAELAFRRYDVKVIRVENAGVEVRWSF